MPNYPIFRSFQWVAFNELCQNLYFDPPRSCQWVALNQLMNLLSFDPPNEQPSANACQNLLSFDPPRSSQRVALNQLMPNSTIFWSSQILPESSLQPTHAKLYYHLPTPAAPFLSSPWLFISVFKPFITFASWLPENKLSSYTITRFFSMFVPSSASVFSPPLDLFCSLHQLCFSNSVIPF